MCVCVCVCVCVCLYVCVCKRTGRQPVCLCVGSIVYSPCGQSEYTLSPGCLGNEYHNYENRRLSFPLGV